MNIFSLKVRLMTYRMAKTSRAPLFAGRQGQIRIRVIGRRAVDSSCPQETIVLFRQLIIQMKKRTSSLRVVTEKPAKSGSVCQNN